ncbi:MAG: IS1595 family transposase [Rhodospirillaceae bacterium]|nr:IS1595 family transposase [Rhodospirillaceae bacterium]MDE0253395.1 IS1595 family transposase [Rhodospirillaceae bacterium]MDE0616402.1 IS1595 family transposase [Rhodospirillaceae bacterium]
MNLITIFQRYPDQEACIEHMERVRWGDEAHCPHCGSVKVARKAERYRVGRWNCHDCKASFNVLSGTIFEKTKIPLQKWFMAIGIMVNAKKSVSSFQLSRDLDMNQKSAWYMQQRIRAAMAADQGPLLQGIVEADETYVGGKPRKPNRRDDDGPGKPRGRGTSKTPVVGAVERGGRAVARIADGLDGKSLLRFLKQNVDPVGTLLITDEWKGYKPVRKAYQHAVIKHSEAYADGDTHTNTIEGVWALLKRARYGQHHHYTRHWMPLFIAEAVWKYNHRKTDRGFDMFMRSCFA